MANGLKFSDRELAELRQVVYGGYKREPDRTIRRRSSQTKTIPGGGIDYNFYSGRQRKKPYQAFEYDMPHFYEDAEKGSTSANFAKIAKELGIKKVDSTKDLQQVYDYVLGYTPPPAAAPVQEKAEPNVQTGFDSSNELPGLVPGGDTTPGETPPGTPPGTPPPATQQPNIASIFADQIKAMQGMFAQSIQQQTMQFQQMQQAQNERMEALQMQMMQSMRDQAAMREARPEVAGVKMAEGTGGTPMQIARRGVSGAFGRRGMRISSLNV